MGARLRLRHEIVNPDRRAACDALYEFYMRLCNQLDVEPDVTDTHIGDVPWEALVGVEPDYRDVLGWSEFPEAGNCIVVNGYAYRAEVLHEAGSGRPYVEYEAAFDIGELNAFGEVGSWIEKTERYFIDEPYLYEVEIRTLEGLAGTGVYADERHVLDALRVARCPFCGGVDAICEDDGCGDDYAVHCYTCGAEGAHGGDKRDAIEAWNETSEKVWK